MKNASVDEVLVTVLAPLASAPVIGRGTTAGMTGKMAHEYALDISRWMLFADSLLAESLVVDVVAAVHISNCDMIRYRAVSEEDVL